MSALARVLVERIVRCPFSVAHDYAEDFFAHAARGVELRVPIRDFARLRRPVRLIAQRRPDEDEPGRLHDALEIDWTAGTHLFPDFHGALRLRIASVDETLLTLEGTYEPPFGGFGAVFDHLVGRRIALATMGDLLRRLGEAMERREADFRAAARPGPSGSAA